IESNLITFLVLQNVTPGGTLPLSWEAAAKQQIMKDLNDNPGNFIKVTDWSLTIRGNFFSAVFTDVNRASPREMYKNLIISENLFQLSGNSFVAQYLNIAHNHFLFEGEVHGLIPIAFAVGFNIVVIGNEGATSKGKFLSRLDAITLSSFIGQEL